VKENYEEKMEQFKAKRKELAEHLDKNRERERQGTIEADKLRRQLEEEEEKQKRNKEELDKLLRGIEGGGVSNVKGIETKIEKLKKEKERLEGEYEKMKEDRSEELRRVEEDVRIEQTKLQFYSPKLKEVEQQLANLQPEGGKAEDDIDRIQKRLLEIEEKREAIVLTENMVELEGKINDLQVKLALIEKEENERQEKAEEIEKLKRELDQSEGDCHFLENLKAKMEQVITIEAKTTAVVKTVQKFVHESKKRKQCYLCQSKMTAESKQYMDSSFSDQVFEKHK